MLQLGHLLHTIGAGSAAGAHSMAIMAIAIHRSELRHAQCTALLSFSLVLAVTPLIMHAFNIRRCALPLGTPSNLQHSVQQPLLH